MKPGCYRVMLQGQRGAVWGPIVDAEDELEAKLKAAHIFTGCEPVEAIFLHPRSDNHHRRLDPAGALEAKIEQAILTERRGGVVPLERRSRAAA